MRETITTFMEQNWADQYLHNLTISHNAINGFDGAAKALRNSFEWSGTAEGFSVWSGRHFKLYDKRFRLIR